eukprot:31486-Pelagococcus_subviridis.AAC.3
MRREKSLRIGVHHANGVVWGPSVARRARTPTTPAAGSACPTDAFAAAYVTIDADADAVDGVDPDESRGVGGGQRGGGGADFDRIPERAVPVPCISKTVTSDALPSADARASRIAVVCAGPFGAVSPLLRPSWFADAPETARKDGARPRPHWSPYDRVGVVNADPEGLGLCPTT